MPQDQVSVRGLDHLCVSVDIQGAKTHRVCAAVCEPFAPRTRAPVRERRCASVVSASNIPMCADLRVAVRELTQKCFLSTFEAIDGTQHGVLIEDRLSREATQILRRIEAGDEPAL